MGTYFQNRRTWILPLVVIAVYAATLLYRYDEVPPGLNNDAAEETMRAVNLLDAHRFQVMALNIGSSAETGYIYLTALVSRAIGPTTLSIHLVCWVFALATILLVWRMTRRAIGDVPPWIPLFFMAGAVWFFHYSRSGLRAVAAPFFLAAFTLLLDRAESRPSDRLAGLAAGLVLGLGLYTYTSVRILPIAFVPYAIYRLIRHRQRMAGLVRCYAAVLAGAAVASIPNILFLIRQPREFLSRGSYVMPGSAADSAFHLFWSVLLPFHYSSYYNQFTSATYHFDGVSAALAAFGRGPGSYLLAGAILLGIYRVPRYLDKPVVQYLIITWIAAMAFLGISGPSLTRLLILLPFYVVLASMGVCYILEKLPRWRAAVFAILLGAALFDLYGYVDGFANTAAAQFYYSPAATKIGEAAAADADSGHRVLCIVTKDRSVVSYLTDGGKPRVWIAEFFLRPLAVEELRLDEFRPDVMLVEDSPVFASFVAQVASGATVIRHPEFTELRYLVH